MTKKPTTTASTGPFARLKRGALWLLFTLILVIPKTLALRRRPGVWNTLRILFGTLGIAGIAYGIADHARTAVLLGLLPLAIALFVTTERRHASVDQRARELGALVVLDGGSFRASDSGEYRARLFVGADRLWVLDGALNPLLDIPLGQGTFLNVELTSEDLWKLHFAWDNSAAHLLYRGPFAEHLARTAEATIRSQLIRELPILR